MPLSPILKRDHVEMSAPPMVPIKVEYGTEAPEVLKTKTNDHLLRPVDNKDNSELTPRMEEELYLDFKDCNYEPASPLVMACMIASMGIGIMYGDPGRSIRLCFNLKTQFRMNMQELIANQKPLKKLPPWFHPVSAWMPTIAHVARTRIDQAHYTYILRDPHVATHAINLINKVSMGAMMHGQFNSLAGKIFESTCKEVMKLLIDPDARWATIDLPTFFDNDRRVHHSFMKALRQECQDTMNTLNCLIESYLMSNSYKDAITMISHAETYYKLKPGRYTV